MRLRRYLTLVRRNRAFSRLFGAQLVSVGGDWFATVAILGLALELTGSPVVASLFLVVQTGFFALAFLLARDPGTLWITFVATALLPVWRRRQPRHVD
jgi:hypothetical protein